jgi:hypothetical protein
MENSRTQGRGYGKRPCFLGRGWARAAALALLALICLMTACEAPPQEPGRGIVLVILDTARADHFSAYGYPRQTTPHFDRLAREGERYTQAYAQSPWTLPSVATILTGLPPHRHGAGRGAGGIFPLYDDVGTLAERLSDVGYRTAAFMNVVWCDPGSIVAGLRALRFLHHG